jgi:flagella basal body P-ring formation protein FlgA
MTCSSRSTRLFADLRAFVASAAVVLLFAGNAAAASTPCADEQVKAAARSTVETRLGTKVDVTLSDFSCALTTEASGPLTATPDPMARTGRPVRFVITTIGSGPRGYAMRLGQATAVLTVSGDYVRARRALTPGVTLGSDDLEVANGPLNGLALRRLPSLAELVGARLVRGVAAGDAIAADAVTLPPAVKFGDQVKLTVRQGGVEATVLAIAEETAPLGQVIRVLNASSRRPLRARVTGNGEVEVVP